MSKADTIYNDLVKRILSEGEWDHGQNVRARWKDGEPAHTISVHNAQMTFTPDEIAILTGKEVKELIARNEIKWIWQDKSNVVQDLRDLNGTGRSVWDEWEITKGYWKGTIGPTYGYALRQPVRSVVRGGLHFELNQVDYLIHQLRHNPASRRHVTTLWIPEDLDSMALTPCVWNTEWTLLGGKLHLKVHSRSGDMGLGVPFNIYQYSVLHRQIAQITGHELGNMVFDLTNAHIYDRHVSELTKQLDSPTYDAPTWWLNPEVTEFDDFKIDDFKLLNYEKGKFIRMQVAV